MNIELLPNDSPIIETDLTEEEKAIIREGPGGIRPQRRGAAGEPAVMIVSPEW